MTVCPTCQHQNPLGATQCEACFTPLPATLACPNCGATTQLNCSFCGNCGINLTHFPNSVASGPSSSPAPTAPYPRVDDSYTQLQQPPARLIHQQTNTVMELPAQFALVHIGKPSGQTPPDIDVSGFPHADVVSRVHANIQQEGSTYYLEDAGSTNGTYVNHAPLPPGTRHRLTSGDRIALGKADLVTFVFVTDSR